MRTIVTKLALATILLAGLFGGSAAACNTDADCQGGGRCMKPYGAAQGVCKGGRQAPAGMYGSGAPQNPSGHQQVCSNDDECPSDKRCAVRADGSGMCVPRR